MPHRFFSRSRAGISSLGLTCRRLHTPRRLSVAQRLLPGIPRNNTPGQHTTRRRARRRAQRKMMHKPRFTSGIRWCAAENSHGHATTDMRAASNSAPSCPHRAFHVPAPPHGDAYRAACSPAAGLFSISVAELISATAMCLKLSYISGEHAILSSPTSICIFDVISRFESHILFYTNTVAARLLTIFTIYCLSTDSSLEDIATARRRHWPRAKHATISRQHRQCLRADSYSGTPR